MANKDYYNGVRDGMRRALQIVQFHTQAKLMQTATPPEMHPGLEETLHILQQIRADRSLRFLERL